MDPHLRYWHLCQKLFVFLFKISENATETPFWWFWKLIKISENAKAQTSFCRGFDPKLHEQTNANIFLYIAFICIYIYINIFLYIFYIKIYFKYIFIYCVFVSWWWWWQENVGSACVYSHTQINVYHLDMLYILVGLRKISKWCHTFLVS